MRPPRTFMDTRTGPRSQLPSHSVSSSASVIVMLLDPLPQTPSRAAKLNRTVPSGARRSCSASDCAPSGTGTRATSKPAHQKALMPRSPSRLLDDVLECLGRPGIVALPQPEQRLLPELGVGIAL